MTPKALGVTSILMQLTFILGRTTDVPPPVIHYTHMINDKQPTYTLWNGSHMVATYPHTREGMDAAMVRAHELLGTGTLTLYSSRDDLVWSSSDEDKEEVTSEQLAEMDTIYDECDDYDTN